MHTPLDPAATPTVSLVTGNMPPLDLAYALVDAAGARLAEVGGRTAATAAIDCFEILDRLASCGADPLALLEEADEHQPPVELLTQAISALDRIPTEEHPPFLDGAYPMISRVLLDLADTNTL